MTSFAKNSQPLYIILVKISGAETKLRAWANQFAVSAVIEGPRMQLFDDRGLSLFQVHWPHDWSAVTIWDCWNKRHVDNN